jgi:hypothetical protein
MFCIRPSSFQTFANSTQGPNGLFKPKTDSFLDCKRDEELCKGFQDEVKHPCISKHKFRCIFDHEYGDGLNIEGHIVMGDVCFKARDGSHLHVHIAFGYVGTGCSYSSS